MTINKENLISLSNSFSSLFYELVYIVDVRTQELVFIANTSGLARRVLKKDYIDHTYKYLVETISGKKDVLKVDNILSLIKRYIDKNPEKVENVLFMTDMNFVLNEEGKSKATYKFVPIILDSEENANHLLGSISMSSGQYVDKLFMLNTVTQERRICNIKDGVWASFDHSHLSPFEMAVLALSAEGLTVSEIAQLTNKAVDTVKSARKRIFAKLEVPNITKAIICGINHKII